MIPESASAHGNYHDGTLAVSLQVCKSPLSERADIGSKAWLLSNALDGGEERQAKGGGRGGGVTDEAREATGAGAGIEGADDSLPEDRFHLRLPKGVCARRWMNQYSTSELHPRFGTYRFNGRLCGAWHYIFLPLLYRVCVTSTFASPEVSLIGDLLFWNMCPLGAKYCFVLIAYEVQVRLFFALVGDFAGCITAMRV